MKVLRIVGGILLGPLLALWLLDHWLVGSDALWTWVAREMPRRVDDPFLVEGTLRAAEPGRHNVVVLGNSRADDGIQPRLLEEELSGHGTRVLNLTVAGTNALHQALLASAVAELEPGLAILVIDPVALASAGRDDSLWAYDAGVAAEIFPPREWLGRPAFHLRGLLHQGHVLARHRQALQYAALVRSGVVDWDDIIAEQDRQAAAREDEETLWNRWMHGEVALEEDGTGFRAVRALGRRLAASGTPLVVVEAPLHPLVPLSLARKQAAAFRVQMQALAEKEGLRFVSAESFRALEVEDFLDLIHLNETGSERYTRDLALAIAPLLESEV